MTDESSESCESATHSPPLVEAVLFDYGGVLAASPFEAFSRYEAENGLEPGFIRSLNSTNPQDNAWARLERNDIGFDEFCQEFDAEAALAGGRVSAKDLFSMFTGELRPAMVNAVRLCRAHFKTGLLTNNFLTPMAAAGAQRGGEIAEVLALFDAVVESSVVGIRKPDPRFYELACHALDVEPTRSVFLDDLGVNLKPARAMGMATIKVIDPGDALQQLESLLQIALR